MVSHMTSSLFDLEMGLGRPPDLPHWLIVKEWAPGDCSELQDDLFEIEHHPDCPTEHRLPWPDIEWEGHGYWAHGCIFQQMVDDAGIDGYFQHRDDPARDTYYAERVDPGRWLIEPWFETYHRLEGNEYDAGLRLATCNYRTRDERHE